MGDQGINLSKKVLTQMVKDQDMGDLKNMKSIYNGDRYKGGESLLEQTNSANRNGMDIWSEPLKRMKAAYLTSIAEKCYQPQHISDDFTNVAQIEICKEEQYNGIFGNFMQAFRNHRESDQIRLTNCNDDAGQDIHRKVTCVETYLRDVNTSNDRIKSLFNQTHKEWL